jgi:hypothetical protein
MQMDSSDSAISFDTLYGGVQKYSSAPISTGNTFQDLPWLSETADNTERYI